MNDPIKKTDTQIQRDVSEELKWDTRVKATDVGVEVHAGVVTLTGTVASWTERVAAQEAAHRVWGVHDVANDIQVKLPSSHVRDDTDIARAVRHALEWDVRVPDDRIRTTVENGTVTLEGAVDFWSEYDDTERCVRNLAGVVHVHNLLEVEPSLPHVGPLAVREAIEHALERHAEHAASHVQVAIAAGKVVLSGAVPSWAELNAVIGAVRGTKGVQTVESHLRVGA